MKSKNYSKNTEIITQRILKQYEAEPITFYSKSCTEAESKYAAREGEALAIVTCCRKLKPLLSSKYTIILTDNTTVIWLLKGEGLSDRHSRWRAEIQAFFFSIQHIPGSKNIIADVLSRSGENIGIDDGFGSGNETESDDSKKNQSNS